MWVFRSDAWRHTGIQISLGWSFGSSMGEPRLGFPLVVVAMGTPGQARVEIGYA